MFLKRNELRTLQVVGFGLSAQYRNSETRALTRKCGTATYMAPEVYFNYEYSKVGSLRDHSTWTFGVWGSLCTSSSQASIRST